MEISEFIDSVLGEQESEPVGESQTVQILQEAPRPFLTTPFEDYSVTEGLLFVLALCAFFSVLARIIKEGFYWLL